MPVDLIYGKWYVVDRLSEDSTYVLERYNSPEEIIYFRFHDRYGEKFEFHENGEFIGRMDHWCGTCGSRRSLGIWKWNDKTGVLFIEIKKEQHIAIGVSDEPVEFNEEWWEFKVIEASDNKLVLKLLKSAAKSQHYSIL